MELNLFFLAPLLKCTSIDRCALFMRAKKILFYWFSVIKILFHSLSHSVPLSLSKSHSIWSSHPFPKLSQALILSQSLSSLTVTLSSSLIHRRRPDPAVPSHSQNSPSLSSLTVTLSSSLIHRRWPDQTADRLSVSSVVVVVVWVDRRRWVRRH